MGSSIVCMCSMRVRRVGSISLGLFRRNGLEGEGREDYMLMLNVNMRISIAQKNGTLPAEVSAP